MKEKRASERKRKRDRERERERDGASEPLNKLLNSHPAGFYFYLNGVAQIRTVILVRSLALNLFVPFVNFSPPLPILSLSWNFGDDDVLR